MFIAALFTRAKIWKQRNCASADEWIKKLMVWGLTVGAEVDLEEEGNWGEIVITVIE